MDNSDGHLIINFMNQDFNNEQFKYETNLMKFDIMKMFCGSDAKQYYLVANAVIKTKTSLQHDLNTYEQIYLLEAMISNLYHMVPFEFDKQIKFDNSERIDEINCF